MAEGPHDGQVHVPGLGVLPFGVLALDEQVPVEEVGQHAVAAGARDQEAGQAQAGLRILSAKGEHARLDPGEKETD